MLKSIKAVEKKRAYENVVVQIRALLDSGRLKQGDQLPTENDLSEMFSVSRATIREAIRTLESLKLVQSRQGEGTYVLASDQEVLIHSLAEALSNETDNIYDIFYVRKIIAPHVAELAAENATPEEINELEALLTEQRKAVTDNVSVAKCDIAFHAALSRASKNPVLDRLLAALSDLVEQTRGEHLQDGERSKKSLAGHAEVFTAVKEKDCHAARLAMRRHLEEMETIVLGKKRNKIDKN
jgi:GntR family transcriptional repressor for pyruvate dehydrogenase complex